MASRVFTSAGTVIAISASLPASNNAAGYQAIADFEPIAEVVDLGEYGRVYNLVTHNPLATRGTVKRKGSYNDGAVNMQLGRDIQDDGQAVAQEALDSDDDYSFRITLQDGTNQYFRGQVMSYTTNVGGVDQITGAAITVEINSEEGIIEDAPSP